MLLSRFPNKKITIFQIIKCISEIFWDLTSQITKEYKQLLSLYQAYFWTCFIIQLQCSIFRNIAISPSQIGQVLWKSHHTPQKFGVDDYNSCLQEMDIEERIIAENICQARNLYKTEFSTTTLTPKQTADLLANKIKTEFAYPTKHFEEALKKQSTQQEKQTAENADDKLINQILKESTEKKEANQQIASLAKYEKNIGTADEQSKSSNAVVLSQKLEMNLAESTRLGTVRATSLRKLIKPTWHRPFKLYRVIAGHHGWVRCLAISPCNTYFASGSADRTIKFWDLASGQLKISLTGHINTIRALQFSKQYPYLFSCGEDKSIKCWDLQMNKVIRNYHGHLSGVYCLKIHDALNVLISGGRDSAARVWDIRVRKQVHALVGHSHTVGSIVTQDSEPHVITGSYDSFIKLWDVGSGRCINTLTNHKKSIRAMVEHPTEYTFASAASDNIKVWKCPRGQFLRNIAGHHSIIDAMAINQDNVLVSGGDDGSLRFWDWQSGYNFQDIMSQPQPGSIAAQNGIFALTFDRSGCRLLSGQCDKTIKMWKQDQNATEETHPIKQFKMEFDRR